MPRFYDFDYNEKVLNLNKQKGFSKEERQRITNASSRARDTRKFETQLFWERGKYYWAFILGAFTAHFYCLSMVLDNGNKEQKQFSLCTFLNLPTLAIVFLALTSFVCFFFCLAWTLMNKGSKFWQKNWERHVNKLEKVENIKLFSTYLTPDADDFNYCPLSFSAYDYSVSKLVLATSNMLMIISLGIFLFYMALLLLKCDFVLDFIKSFYLDQKIINCIVFFGICTGFVTFLYIFVFRTVGNPHTEDEEKGTWHQDVY